MSLLCIALVGGKIVSSFKFINYYMRRVVDRFGSYSILIERNLFIFTKRVIVCLHCHNYQQVLVDQQISLHNQQFFAFIFLGNPSTGKKDSFICPVKIMSGKTMGRKCFPLTR